MAIGDRPVFSLLLTVAATPSADATGAPAIRMSTGLAPVAPDGLTVGSPTDFLITLRDTDPRVPGIGLKAGGTIRVRLPGDFVNIGEVPVAGSGTIPGCAPPLVSSCSTAVTLQGWAQSLQPPFPDVVWDEVSNTITLTARQDWLPAGFEAPGPKTVHLQLLGFRNPTKPGGYRFDVEVRPDPASDLVLRDHGRVRIASDVPPFIGSVSLANGAPPPPFPNTLYQPIPVGEPSLTMMLYLWGRDLQPLDTVDFVAGSQRLGALADGEGNRVGFVKVRAPKGARNWSLASTGPAEAGAAFITATRPGSSGRSCKPTRRFRASTRCRFGYGAGTR